MPIYDYDCANCGGRFEVMHGVHADSPAACPLCGGGPVRKAITAAAIHYKGSGWAKKERRATASPGAAKTGADNAGEGSGATTDGSPGEPAKTKDASTATPTATATESPASD